MKKLSNNKEKLNQASTIYSINIAIDGRRLELKAATEILPGMFVKRIDAQYVEPHSVQSDISPRLIAVENFYLNNKITHPYAIDDTVYMYHCLPGDVVYGLVSPTSLHIDAGDFLTCADDGALMLTCASYAPPPITTDRGLVGMAVGSEVTLETGEVYIATEVW